MFYGENQGIWSCAININDIDKEDVKIYIDFEQMGFEEEAKSFRDFIIVKTACDYSIFIYPVVISAEHINQEHINVISKIFGTAKSDINPKGYYRRKLFWKDENEVVIIIEWDEKIWNGKKTIRVVSKNKSSISKYQKLLNDLKWNVTSQDKIMSQGHLPYYLEKEEPTINNIDESDNSSNDNFDLPF